MKSFVCKSLSKQIKVACAVIVIALVLPACTTESPTIPATQELNSYVLPSVINATGVVVPSQWASISVQSNGLVEKLHVTEGQKVTVGEILMTISGHDQLIAQLESAKLNQLQAQQQYDDLFDNWEQGKAAAQLRLAEAEKAYDKAVDRRSWKEYSHGSEEQIDSARADYIIAQDNVDKLEDAFSGLADRAEDDLERAAALSQLAAARQARDRAEANLNYLLKIPDAIEVSESEGQLEVARAELSAATTDWEKLKEGPDPDQLALIEANLNNARAQVQAVETNLKNLEPSAPFTGTVSKLYVRENEWVMPGQAVMLFGNLDDLQVETTDLSEIDVAQLEPDLPVKVSFDALPDVLVDGKIERISPKAEQGSGVNYTVIVKMDQVPEKLLWGMTAFVDIELP